MSKAQRADDICYDVTDAARALAAPPARRLPLFSMPPLMLFFRDFRYARHDAMRFIMLLMLSNRHNTR